KRRTVSDKERESNPYTSVQVGINQRATDARLPAVRTTFRGTRPSRRQSSPSGVLPFERQILIIAKREEPSPMNHSIFGRLGRALQVNHATKIAVVSERHSKHDATNARMLHQVIAALRSRVEGARKVTHDSAMRRIRKRAAQRPHATRFASVGLGSGSLS